MECSSCHNPHAALTGEPDRLSQDDEFGLFWRTAPSDELQGQVLATEVAGVYPAPSIITRVVAAYRDDPYGLGLANAFQVSFGGETLLQSFDVGGDLVAAAAAAAAAAPDAVLFVDIGGDRATAFIEAMAAEPALADLPLYLADGSKTDTLLDAACAVFDGLRKMTWLPPGGRGKTTQMAAELGATAEDALLVTVEAPSDSGVELAAVSVPLPSGLANAGPSFASLSGSESGRRFWSRASPR